MARTQLNLTTHRFIAASCPLPVNPRVVIVSDTHSRPHERTLERISLLNPDALLHAGDIGDLAVLDAFAELAVLFAVRGNIDGRTNELPDSIALAFKHGERRLLRVLLTHIALYGPKLLPDVATRAREGDCSLVVCGHSHVPFLGRDKGLTVFNPGSVGPRRFGLPITLGVLDISPDRIDIHHVDVETGERWVP